MSYILDALKKAESERNSGAASQPQAQLRAQLHALHPTGPEYMDEESSVRKKAWIRFGLTAIAAVLLALAWFRLRPALPPVAPPAPPVAAVAPQPAPAAPAPPAVIAQAPPAPPVTPPPAVAAAAPPKAPAKPAKEKASPAKETAPKKPARTAAPAKPKVAENTAAASGARIAALHELPQHIRNEIPAYKINGYIYSQNKTARTVLINNKLLHEGDQVAPDLVLEKLTPAGMVLNFKGYRYRASY
jgi:general secretion pathway protein B